jgi:hypothetical protein
MKSQHILPMVNLAIIVVGLGYACYLAFDHYYEKHKLWIHVECRPREEGMPIFHHNYRAYRPVDFDELKGYICRQELL